MKSAHTATGLLELAGKAGGAGTLRVRPTPALSPSAINTARTARGDRRGDVADMDHERAADHGAVNPSGGVAEVMRDRHRGLASRCDSVNVDGLRPASAIPIEWASHLCEMSGVTLGRVVSAGPTMAIDFSFILFTISSIFARRAEMISGRRKGEMPWPWMMPAAHNCEKH